MALVETWSTALHAQLKHESSVQYGHVVIRLSPGSFSQTLQQTVQASRPVTLSSVLNNASLKRALSPNLSQGSMSQNQTSLW